MLQIGSIVDGKYKVLNKIGQGGMSIVYLAMNEKANKQWAIKEVRKDGIKDFEVVKQGLVVETDMLKNLNHPNLPSIIDVIEEDDNFLIVMDYIQGNPLNKALDEYGAQPQEDVIGWAKQLCGVLGYLHSRVPAIIYRDMKPSNVMLKPDGNITLIDFGTAREYKERNLADTTCLGTVGYAAPEQFGGQGQTDERTDIYCLGATIYNLVTGHNPSEPPYEMGPIRAINPGLSSGLEKIILKATQRNPADRYQSCAELLYALEHYEEIDDLHRKKQKKKVALFLAMSSITLLCLITGIGARVMATTTNNKNYDSIITSAEKTTDMDKKKTLYLEAVQIRPSQKEAYLGLVKAYKEDMFSIEEESELKNLINQHEEDIINNSQTYVAVSFEIGLLYWYYYDYGKTETNDNQVTRMKSAVKWFEDTVNNSKAETFEKWNMAKIYSDIGKFNRDISINVKEASDKGTYEPYWRNLVELVDLVEKEKGESEIVKLELYKLAMNAIETYTKKFENDGIKKEEMETMLERVIVAVKAVDTLQGDETESLKEYIVGRYDTTLQAIELVFAED